jgi:hypothetical protein
MSSFSNRTREPLPSIRRQPTTIAYTANLDARNRSCHTAHASIHLAAQGTQHERCGLQFGVRPFVLSSPLFGRIEGLLSLNCGFKVH